MGSIIYNFLADSLLLHKGSLDSNFAKESIERLEQELQAYREYCIANYHELINEIKSKQSPIKVFSSTENVTLNLLTQTALYIEQFIIPDPIFKFTDRQSEAGRVTAKYLGYEERHLDKRKLKDAAQFLKNITPMVAGDFVKIFPLSYHFEGPKVIPFNIPVNFNNGLLPDKIRDFFWENVEVKSMIKSSEGWIVDHKLYPCRGIIVEYKESTSRSGMLYHLFQVEVSEFDEATGQATFVHTLPDTPPEIEEFKAWVTQSVNAASKIYFDSVYIETYLAANLNSTYLTDNPFTAKVISENYDLNDSIGTFTTNKLLNIDLPFIDNIDIDKLMSIREFDADVFTNFRLELEKHFRELRTISDEDTIKKKIENIFHELNDVQGYRIKKKIERLRKQFGINTLLGVAGLGGAIHTGGLSLLATATAIAKGYKDYQEFKEKVTENPAYLLWKIKKER
jgi:hypothetical protein